MSRFVQRALGQKYYFLGYRLWGRTERKNYAVPFGTSINAGAVLFYDDSLDVFR